MRLASPPQVAEWRQLPAVAALVRFAEDPQWLAVEWADGTPAATYVTPARDALLAAVLDAAQAAAGRPIPVLSQPTTPGDVIVVQRAQAVAAPAVADGEPAPRGIAPRAPRSPLPPAVRLFLCSQACASTPPYRPLPLRPQMLSWTSSAYTS